MQFLFNAKGEISKIIKSLVDVAIEGVTIGDKKIKNTDNVIDAPLKKKRLRARKGSFD